MAKEVDLLSYWMPVLRQLREFRELANAEEPEIRLILEAIDRTISNFFITTADEYGIARFEKMLGIFPEEEADLELRRVNVLIKWNSVVPYTDEELHNRLLSFCGEGKFSITPHYEEYTIDISVDVGVKGAFDTITLDILDMLPCNLVPTIKNFLKAQKSTPLSVGAVITDAMSYQITNDIKRKESPVSPFNIAVVNSVAPVLTLRDENTATALLGRSTIGLMVLNTYTI